MLRHRPRGLAGPAMAPAKLIAKMARGRRRGGKPNVAEVGKPNVIGAQAPCRVCLPGKLGVPPQLHGGLDRLDTLASFRDSLIERGLEPLIGFDQLRVLIRRGDRLV
jgi:hypothetical protein